MAKMIRPVGVRILVESAPIAEYEKKGAIMVSGATIATYFKGKVLAVGTEVKLVQKGENIAFLKYGYDEIEVDDKKYYLVEETSVIAVYDDK